MQKITLSLITSLTLLSNTLHADWWQDTKVVVNKAEFWKSKHLKDIDFKHIYPKKFYKKSYFGFVVTGVTIVGAGAFSYFTAGAGAPTAAAGVGAVAAWVGGGGAGAFMAGLAIIGGWFGGNAMLGAAILNGIAIGTLGGGVTTFAKLSLLGKIGVMASITSMGLDGVVYFQNPTTKKLEYRIKLMIPKNLGSKDTRDIVDKIYDIEENIQDDYSDNNGTNSQKLLNSKQELEAKAIKLLKNKLDVKDNQEDLIVLSIIASNTAEYVLFDKAISHINSSKLNNTSFLNYLKALNSLYNGEERKSLEYLDSAISENPYALEAIILNINILGNLDFLQNEIKIKDLIKTAEENFDSDYYASSYSLSGVYYRVATFYFNNKRYVSARKYYEKAYDELGILQRNFFGKELGHTIQLGIANSLYKEGKVEQSSKIYSEIIEDIDDDKVDEKRRTEEQYLGAK
jgi:tetratricopeptide (TPR) repeat protein